MSMIRCDVCQRYVDQDFHETHGPTGETCEECALEAEDMAEIEREERMADKLEQQRTNT
jgi:hypothetical protein